MIRIAAGIMTERGKLVEENLRMVEAVVAVAGIIACWLIGIVIYKEDMSLTRYGFLAILSVTAAYLAIRFIHWAWVTPLPFAGTTR
jgi:hypothetical protein